MIPKVLKHIIIALENKEGPKAFIFLLLYIVARHARSFTGKNCKRYELCTRIHIVTTAKVDETIQ